MRSSSVVVDTSVFVDYFRGNSDNALAVLILKNSVLLSSVVKLELMAGVEKRQISVVETLCDSLETESGFPDIDLCNSLIKKARGSGLFGGIPDILIIATALENEISLFTYDQKMKRLAKKLGAKLF